MTKILAIALALFSLTVHGQDSTTWVKYHAIQAKLDSLYDLDQSDRVLMQKYFKKNDSQKVDSLAAVISDKDESNLSQVKAVLDKDGWLGINEIGEKANLVLFLVIQHADSLTQVNYLPMMREAVAAGRAKPKHLALLEDRVLTNQGKPQIYGSQVHRNKKGQDEFFPIGDERNVNVRRAAVGLEPLEEYARNFNIKYHLPQ
jgi:hypothetical protein